MVRSVLGNPQSGYYRSLAHANMCLYVGMYMCTCVRAHGGHGGHVHMYNLAIPIVTFQVVGLTAIQAPGTFSHPKAIEGQREYPSTAPTSRASLVL